MSSLLSPLTRLNIILLCVGTLFFVLIQLIVGLSGIVTMLAGALLLSYLLLSPVRFIGSLLYRARLPLLRTRTGLRRILSILMAYLLFFGSCAVIVVCIAPPLLLQLKDFAQDAPLYVSEVDLFLTDVEALVSQKSPDTFQARWKTLHRPQIPVPAQNPLAPVKRLERMARPQQLLSQTARLTVEKLRQVSQETVHTLVNMGSVAISGMVYTLTALVLSFYLLHDGRNLRKGLVSFMPTRQEGHTARFFHRVHLHVYNLVKAQALMSILSGGLLYAVLVVFDVKYALLLSASFALASIVPVLGCWLGLLPIAFVLALGGQNLCLLTVVLLIACFHMIRATYLWPMILHVRYRTMHPVLFVLTLLVCIHLLGFIGVLLVFPLSGVLAVSAEWLQHRHTTVKA